MKKEKAQINPICGKRLQELIQESGMLQKEFAEKAGYSPEYISAITTGKKALPMKTAKEMISKFFPKVSLEWLMGETDYRNIYAKFQSQIEQCQYEGILLSTGLSAFGELAGYRIKYADIHDGISLEELLGEMKNGYKITKGEETISLSIDEMNQFENEVLDFVELKFKHLFKQKGEKNNG